MTKSYRLIMIHNGFQYRDSCYRDSRDSRDNIETLQWYTLIVFVNETIFQYLSVSLLVYY